MDGDSSDNNSFEGGNEYYNEGDSDNDILEMSNGDGSYLTESQLNQMQQQQFYQQDMEGEDEDEEEENDEEGEEGEDENDHEEEGSFNQNELHQQMSDQEEDPQIHYQQQYREESEEAVDEEQDQVNEMSFNNNHYKHTFNQQQYGQYEQECQQQQEEEEDQEDNDQDDEDEEDEDDDENDNDVGEMKAKFDKIMANFIDESKGGNNNPYQSKGNQKLQQSQREQAIEEFKNKNLHQNVRGIIKTQAADSDEEEDDEDEEEEEVDAIVEGPNHEDNEQSVNIKINKKQLFPTSNQNHNATNKQQNIGKPPIPIKATLKANIINERRSSTPDREKPLRERYAQQNYQPIQRSASQKANKENKQIRPKSAKVQFQDTKTKQKRPQTAVHHNNYFVVQDENQNDMNIQQKKPPVPKVSTLKRPMTAGPKPTTFKKTNQNKKSDPVSRMNNLRNEWQKNTFLKAQSSKQGRKLELDRFHKWSSIVHSYNNQTKQKKPVQKYISNPKPIDDRRDELRFQLRAKISQKDYVDKQMKAFHYNQEAAQHQVQKQFLSQIGVKGADNGEKIEELRKQINALKNCIN